MKFDSSNLPQENGADDLQDSARLAGIMATFNYYLNGAFDISQYVNLKEGRYERHPDERRYDFSRDQALCLMAGLYFQNHHDLVDLKYVDGIDIFTPAHRGHVKRCQLKKTNWLEDVWLWFDVWRHTKKPVNAESNQMLCQLMVAPKKYLIYYLANDQLWQDKINYYWRDSYRNEPELAAHMIKVLKEYL